MSDRARDVVRYIKAIEDTGGYKTVYVPSVWGGLPFAMSVPTADRYRAEMSDLFDPMKNALAAIRHSAARHDAGILASFRSP